LGNYTDPNVLLDRYSADALRYLLVSSPLLNGDDFALIDKDVSDIQRKLGTLWNSYGFLVMYANVDKWTPENSNKNIQGVNLLDKWIVSKLHKLIKVVDENMCVYDLPNATKPIMDFIDDLSNWYIRRSRKRFWKSEDDGDKKSAYQTLHYALVELSKVMAPFTPFIAEEIYKNLTSGESVHLVDFPAANEHLIDDDLNEKMSNTRKIITEALQLRAKNGIKVRQPLSELIIVGYEMQNDFIEILKEEVNVKSVVIKKGLERSIELNTEINEVLRLEGYARELIRIIQEMRKEAGYEVDNRIRVGYEGMAGVFDKFGAMIKKEVLADNLEPGLLEEKDIEKEFLIENNKVVISIKR